jgi:release factor glutamine methyltransferase
MENSINSIIQYYRASLDSIDIEVLLMRATGKSREFLLAHPEYVLTDAEYAEAVGYLERRAKHEPIAYILGHREFYSLDFLVNQHTLIPRPETELLVEIAFNRSKEYEVRSKQITHTKSAIIDVGTGSGNIIIALAKKLLDSDSQLSTFDCFGLDVSEDALAIAKENAVQHQVDTRITFLQSDLLEAFFNHTAIQPYSHTLILANLPYLSEEIYHSAEADVKDFEPVTALVSDEAGLAHYRRLLEQVTLLRQEHIFSPTTSLTMIFEISPEQHAAIEMLIREFFSDAHISLIKDYSQRFRFVRIELIF